MLPADPNAEALLRLLPYGQWNIEGGREVLDALLGLGERAVGTLVRTLSDPARPRFLRLASAWILGRIGTERASECLCSVLGDTDEQVASSAARALGLASAVHAAA